MCVYASETEREKEARERRGERAVFFLCSSQSGSRVEKQPRGHHINQVTGSNSTARPLIFLPLFFHLSPALCHTFLTLRCFVFSIFASCFLQLYATQPPSSSSSSFIINRNIKEKQIPRATRSPPLPTATMGHLLG